MIVAATYATARPTPLTHLPAELGYEDRDGVASGGNGLDTLPTKVLLCSASIPPGDAGAAVVLGRLFRRIDPRSYCIVSFATEQGSDEAPIGLPSALPAQTYRLTSHWYPPGPSSYPLAPVRAIRRHLEETVRRARRLADVVDAERCGALIVTSGGNPDLAAGFVASRLTRTPLVVYMFDEWRYQLPHRSMRLLRGQLQRLVLRGADAVIVPNDLLKAELDSRYGSRCAVIPNPVDDIVWVDEPDAEREWPTSSDEIRIVYTGQVYAAQYDAFARLLDALGSPRLERFTLHVYTAQPPDQVRRGALDERITIHPFLHAAEIAGVQRSADILFLPLAFASPYPEIIRTSAPTKLGEYLASGTPILIHAPRGSFVSVLGRREECAEVVDVPGPELIVEALLRIADDADHRRRLVANAQAVARRDYAPAATSQRFVRRLESFLGVTAR